ncbi:uncharacterized protein LOC129048411 isoform X2 [Pongo abelii]|uniref:uncharacterized protein LOC129048411 isoform X2 n=1 Tax=Pongo abelii TaxID=9601 RepID=UPI0023E8DE85|nr:uncharacterized protein LOC129048411 isoform X2 [Pongo abelii]
MDAQQQGNARHRDARQHGNARHTDARQHGNARHTDARQHGNPRHMDARQYVNTSQGRRAAREHISHGCRAAREHKSTWRQILEAGSPRSSQFRFWGGLILTDGRPLALLLHDVTKRLRTQNLELQSTLRCSGKRHSSPSIQHRGPFNGPGTYQHYSCVRLRSRSVFSSQFARKRFD